MIVGSFSSPPTDSQAKIHKSMMIKCWWKSPPHPSDSFSRRKRCHLWTGATSCGNWRRNSARSWCNVLLGEVFGIETQKLRTVSLHPLFAIPSGKTPFRKTCWKLFLRKRELTTNENRFQLSLLCYRPTRAIVWWKRERSSTCTTYIERHWMFLEKHCLLELLTAQNYFLIAVISTYFTTDSLGTDKTFEHTVLVKYCTRTTRTAGKLTNSVIQPKTHRCP